MKPDKNAYLLFIRRGRLLPDKGNRIYKGRRSAEIDDKVNLVRLLRKFQMLGAKKHWNEK